MQADFSRNFGLLTAGQQQKLGDTHVLVCGVGGMGGLAAEALVRMGLGAITIADGDTFEPTDINRQMHCTQAVMGCLKVDVIAERLLAINPALDIKTARKLDADNAAALVGPVDLVVNGMDCVRSSICLEREARRQGKTIVDAWLTPYASVMVMTPEAPHWEEFLEFPTRDKPLSEITTTDIERCLRQEIRFTLSHFSPYDILTEKLVEEVITGLRPRPSLLPVVWISGTLMANEVLKVITSQGRTATHWGVFYNQYDHQLVYYDKEGEISGDTSL